MTKIFNNAAELVAIGLILQELIDLFPTLITKPGRVFIFTDSLYASSAVQSSKAPLAHSGTILALRDLFVRVSSLFRL